MLLLFLTILKFTQTLDTIKHYIENSLQLVNKRYKSRNISHLAAIQTNLLERSIIDRVLTQQGEIINMPTFEKKRSPIIQQILF